MNEAQARWRGCLASAFRTALACTIVGCATLYSPAFLQRQIPFPAFSYVTAILIVSTDATLGDTLRGCWLALYATAQIAGPAILCLWLIGPARLSSLTTALAVALCAFVVALPESTHLVAKRIALGQSVILYVIAFINGADADAVMHPVHVAASTAVGALASLLALLLPYPRLAFYEVKQKSKLLAENAAERQKLFVQAFCAEDGTSPLALISQAKSCGLTGTKFFQSIETHKESMQWERLAVKIFQPCQKNTGDRLQDTEILFRGMEMALTSISSYPVKMLDGELKDDLLRLLIKQAESFLPIDPVSTVPESSSAEDHHIMKSLPKLQTIPITHQDLPSFFFLFCMNSIHEKSLTKPSVTKPDNACKINVFCFNFKGIWSSSRLMPAFKCALSLGLAVLFGLLYSKENGYWSALPVAISLASAREPTFKVANIKAQGTALGTVYGVLGCFLFKKFLPIRILSLLPWFILTDFLRRDRIYGQAGGISAAIGAVLILGRKNFGPPGEFGMARITETFIGLSCSIIVELILQPTRASTLSKNLLSKSLGTLHTCVNSVSLGISSELSDLEQNQKRLQIQISELEKVIEEADVEPNFWFFPFHTACYGRLLQSLSKMVDLLHFIAQTVGYISLQQESQEGSWKEVVSKLNDDVKLFKEMVGSSIKCSEQVTSVKSLTLLEKELEKKNVSCDDDDLELGKSQNPKIVMVSSLHENGMEEIIDSYLQHSEELLDKIHDEDVNQLKCQALLNLAALGFCMSSLVKETREIEKEIKELVQWENPLSHIDLKEISSKIHALHKL